MNCLSLTCPLARLSGEVAWGAFEPIYSPAQQSWAQERLGLCLPLSTSSAVPSHGPEGLGGHMLLLPLGSSTFPLLHTEKGNSLKVFLFFLPLWLEKNPQLLKESIGQDAGVRNNLDGLSLGQVSGNPQLYQFSHYVSGKKMSFVVHATLVSLQSVKGVLTPSSLTTAGSPSSAPAARGKMGEKM